MKRLGVVFYCFIFIFSISCKKHEKTPAPVVQENNTSNASFIEIGQAPSTVLKQIATQNGYGSFAEKIKYDVTIAKIKYKTTYRGKTVDASGLIFFPNSNKDVIPLLCFNHGTLFSKSDAPSLNPLSSGLELVSSTGYVIVEPDYLGYGASSSLFHPYYDEGYSASVVYDIIQAAREASASKKIVSNNKVFMIGYSEGGYVTFAAQKKIESNPSKDWTLTGVAAGAGGYDLQEVVDNLSGNNFFNVPAYLAFLIKAYNITNDWNLPMKYFFANNYANVVDTYVDGNHGGSFINDRLSNRLDSLFNPTFYEGIKNKSTTDFRTAIINNSLTDWKITVPTRMYHGTSDSTVYYSNSQSTYKKLIANGSKDLTFISIPGGTHGSSLQPMLIDVIPWFEELNKQ